MSRPGVFVDRDGVINDLVPDPRSGAPESPLRPEDVVLVPGAAAALRRLSAAGWVLVGVSNQPAAAKAMVTLEQLQAVQSRVLELVAAEGIVFDDFQLCLHHPDGVVPELTGSCDCRKPAPGMLHASAATLDLDLPASWMIGDTDSDVAAGRAAGCATILVQHPGSSHKRASGQSDAHHEALDLAAAADLILKPKG